MARVAEGLGVAWNTANSAVLAEGQRVLIDDPLPAGPHSVEWNGRDAGGVRVPSGVYMLKVNYPGGTHVSKTLLIR